MEKKRGTRYVGELPLYVLSTCLSVSACRTFVRVRFSRSFHSFRSFVIIEVCAYKCLAVKRPGNHYGQIWCKWCWLVVVAVGVGVEVLSLLSLAFMRVWQSLCPERRIMKTEKNYNLKETPHKSGW